MTKASFRRTHKSDWNYRLGDLSVWQQLIYLCKKYSKSPKLVAPLALVFMLLWNWKLLLATSAGVGIMLLIYLIPGSNWRVYWAQAQRFLSGSNGRLIMSVGGGALVAFGTYAAACIWSESENSWLATGWIIQGLLSSFTFVLLVWQILTSRGTAHKQGLFEQFLLDLTSKDPLKRLLAVRQLTHLVNYVKLPQKHQLEQYFRLMLTREDEPIIREALLESLLIFDQKSLITQKNQQLQMPVNFSKAERPVYHLENDS